MNFYKEAAKVLDDLMTKKQGSLKSVVFNSNSTRSATEQKRLYALLSETLKKKDTLESVIESSQLLKIERKALLVMGGIAAGTGPIKDAILRHKTRLKADFVKAELCNNKPTSLVKPFIPRWVRINQLKTTMEDFLSLLNQRDFRPVIELKDIESTKTGYLIDSNVPDLLAFSPHYPIQSTFKEEYASGTIILQDKASSIPVVLLDSPRGAHALDACAAPGNKTIQLAAAVGPTGHVVAVERDEKRAETLRQMVEKAGATKCRATPHNKHTHEPVTEIINSDFTKVEPAAFGSITHILLDPSCSGSGLDRPDYTTDTDSDLHKRLERLARFQTTLLKHAMSFPKVEKIVYSTCSVHAEENERVVSTVLMEMKGWRIVTRDEQVDGLRKWPRRGFVEESPSREVAEACIRCEKGTDGTIGFFAVAFTRSHKEAGIEEEEWQGIP